MPGDAIIVDAASMVDLPLLAWLIHSIAPRTRLIEDGDKDSWGASALGRSCATGSPASGEYQDLERCYSAWIGVVCEVVAPLISEELNPVPDVSPVSAQHLERKSQLGTIAANH
jgi:hypothetical protein